MNDSHVDTLQRFVFENKNVRGELVHLRGSYQAARGKVPYPGVVAEQLGQALAASVLLGATIKFEGALILQIQSSGPITMLVAQCTDQCHVRGLARWQGQAIAEGELDDIFGQGRIAITINTKNYKDRYQGVVSLDGKRLADALENYFQQSEQLPTRLFLFANQDDAVGLLLQRLPGGEDEDLWQRVSLFAETLTQSEMFSLSNEEILHRLFHEETIRIFDEEPVSFRCTCSRERIEEMLISLGNDEARAIIAEQGQIEVGCEFCNHQYSFDKVDVEQLFATDIKAPSPKIVQ